MRNKTIHFKHNALGWRKKKNTAFSNKLLISKAVFLYREHNGGSVGYFKILPVPLSSHFSKNDCIATRFLEDQQLKTILQAEAPALDVEKEKESKTPSKIAHMLKIHSQSLQELQYLTATQG